MNSLGCRPCSMIARYASTSPEDQKLATSSPRAELRSFHDPAPSIRQEDTGTDVIVNPTRGTWGIRPWHKHQKDKKRKNE